MTAFDAYDAEGSKIPSHPDGLFGLPDDGPVQAVAATELGCWLPDSEGWQPAGGGSIVVVCRGEDRTYTLVAADEAFLYHDRDAVATMKAASVQPLWSVVLKAKPQYCNGLIALSRASIVIIGACDDNGFLAVHSLASGKPLARSSKLFSAAHIAADDSGFVRKAKAVGRHADVFVSAREALYEHSGDDGTFNIYHFCWTGWELIPQVRQRVVVVDNCG